MRDSYDLFFKKFNIKENDLIKFGLKDIIYIPFESASKNWEELKVSVFKNKTIFVRGLGRDAANTQIVYDMHKYLFNNNKIQKDSTNNAYPTKILEELSGYSKKKKSKNLISNYQVSHVFGRTKNALTFGAPWNIVYVPKIYDPLTGHESSGALKYKFRLSLEKQTYKKFKPLIEDYNSIINNSEFNKKLEKALEKILKNKSKYNYWKKQDMAGIIKNEFSLIKLKV